MTEDDRASALAAVRQEAAGCTRCPLYRNATQTVFGEGGVGADLMLVGEQPGDREDVEGRPFVGPAGRVLDRALAEAGIDRRRVYVTNAVKHFKNEPRGKRRLHKKPDAREIEICRWWLDRELDLVRPRRVVALGASAARALFGRPLAVGRSRGRAIPMQAGRDGFVTVHPSFVLRQRDDAAREAVYRGLVDDLRAVAATG